MRLGQPGFDEDIESVADQGDWGDSLVYPDETEALGALPVDDTSPPLPECRSVLAEAEPPDRVLKLTTDPGGDIP